MMLGTTNIKLLIVDNEIEDNIRADLKEECAGIFIDFEHCVLIQLYNIS